MSDGIFVVQDDGSLIELHEEPYDTEALLQDLLERYPRLLGGATSEARGLLLIKREAGIPGEAAGGDRWSLDHLFVDRAAVPTLVEVKRSSDTRIRREVVGQMLDYAANAVVYWPIERIRADFRNTASEAGEDPDERLRAFLGGEGHEEFWARVKTNLQAGKIRMIFVADELPSELRRVIEFLNDQMDPAEVLGIEVRQYTGEGIQSLVPRVVGRSAEAERRKGKAPEGRQWDETSFMEVLGTREGGEREIASEILGWAKSRELRLWWGTGVKYGSFYPLLDIREDTQYTFAVRSGYRHGYVQFQFAQMRAPFDSEERRAELIRKLGAEAGINLSLDSKYPSARLDQLDRPSLDGLLAVFDWVLEETRSASGDS